MPNTNISEHGGQVLLPEHCEANELDMVNCSFCDGAFEDDGEELCPNCRENTTGCVQCGERIYWESCCVKDGDDYCSECFNEKFFTCIRCHRVRELDDMLEGADGESYCPACYERFFTTCSNCEEVIWQEDSHYSERAGDLCHGCYESEERANGALHSHHEWEGDLRFHHVENGEPISSRREKPGVLYLGVELETDGDAADYDINSCAEALSEFSDDEVLFHMEDDGSLRNGGLEIITQPATLEFLRKQFPWEDVCRTVARHGGQSHDSSRCGLHVHFNSTWFGVNYDLHTLKLLYIFERWWEQMVQFSRRSGDSWKQYAMRYDDDFTDADNAPEKIQKTKYKGRYFAVNIENDNTIELRIFKGTLRNNTLMAALEFVDFLARFVKTVSIGELQEMSWLGLIAHIDSALYPGLADYLVRRNLNTTELI